MNEFGLEELKRVESDILKWIKRICDQHHLRYWLAYGTLLGAVRHKGFIPWDDDIDIHMPREDYERFILIANEQRSDHFSVKSCTSDEDYYYEFAKVVDTRTDLKEDNVKPIPGMGAWVDIFPLDGVPEKYDMHIYSLLAMVKMRVLSVKETMPEVHPLLKPFVYVVWKIARLLDSNRLAVRTNGKAGRFGFDSSGKVASSVSSAGVKGVFDRSLFDESVEVPFEGDLFKAPAGWDTYLKQTYGNYMELPPEDKQVAHHTYSIKWKNNIV